MKEVKLKELNIDFIDGDRGKNYPKQNEIFETGDCLFLNAKNVTPTGFDFNEKNFITKEKDSILRNGKMIRGDIVLTTRGTLGNTGFYSENIEYEDIRINSGMLILRCNDNINNKYIYWQLRSNYFQNQIKQMKSGSAQPQLPISILKNLKIKMVDNNDQAKIVNILDIIDYKIIINNQINDNLLVA